MSNTIDTRPMEEFKVASQNLRESSMFTARHASTCSTRANDVHAAVQNLNMDEIFSQLHKLVDLACGKVDVKELDTAPVPSKTSPDSEPLAAE